MPEKNIAPIGAQILLGASSSDKNSRPSLATLSDGSYVAAWRRDHGGAPLYYEIEAQRFSPAGVPLETPVAVNTNTALYQLNPQITQINNDEFVVVWDSDAGSADVHGQRFFSANSTQTGSEFTINAYTTDGQSNPVVAGLEGGGFITSWVSGDQDTSGSGIYGQCYASTGSTDGSEFPVNTYTTNHQSSPAVVALPGGGFVLAWQSTGQDGSTYTVVARQYDDCGSPAGGEFQVNTYTSGFQWQPEIARQTDRFFIVWSGDGPVRGANNLDIYGQFYALNGAALNGNFAVSSQPPEGKERPVVAALPNDDLVVVWQESDCTHGQYLAPEGEPIGGVFSVGGSDNDCEQEFPDITALPDNSFVVSWGLVNVTASQVYAQRYFLNTYPEVNAPLSSVKLDVGREAFSFAFPANAFSDADGHALQYAAQLTGSALPGWLTFDSSSRTFTGDLAEDSSISAAKDQGFIGTGKPIWVTAQDGFGGSANTSFNLALDFKDTSKVSELGLALGLSAAGLALCGLGLFAYKKHQARSSSGLQKAAEKASTETELTNFDPDDFNHTG